MTESRPPVTARPQGRSQWAGRGGAAPANLADILERVLDKGIVIAGDIRVNLLDIELLTIKIRLLVASVDKAKEMGIDWWRNDPMLTPGPPRTWSARTVSCASASRQRTGGGQPGDATMTDAPRAVPVRRHPRPRRQPTLDGASGACAKAPWLLGRARRSVRRRRATSTCRVRRGGACGATWKTWCGWRRWRGRTTTRGLSADSSARADGAAAPGDDLPDDEACGLRLWRVGRPSSPMPWTGSSGRAEWSVKAYADAEPTHGASGSTGDRLDRLDRRPDRLDRVGRARRTARVGGCVPASARPLRRASTAPSAARGGGRPCRAGPSTRWRRRRLCIRRTPPDRAPRVHDAERVCTCS